MRDHVCRFVLASVETVFEAHVRPEQLVRWRFAPSLRVTHIALIAETGGGWVIRVHDPGNTSWILRARFEDLVQNRRIVEALERCDGSVPPTRVVTLLESALGCTRVEAIVDPGDHLDAGASLGRLATLVEPPWRKA